LGVKRFVGDPGKLSFKDHGLTGGREVILPGLTSGGASGTDGVVVKYVDIIRNSEGEGRKLIS